MSRANIIFVYDLSVGIPTQMGSLLLYGIGTLLVSTFWRRQWGQGSNQKK